MDDSSKSELKKPTFRKVSELRPLDTRLSLTVKVIDAKAIVPRGRKMRTTECLVGDETGINVFVARNDQVDLMKEGKTVTLRNAKIEMFKGSMRLAVDKWGKIETGEPADFAVKEDNNLSLIEFETSSNREFWLVSRRRHRFPAR